MKVKDLKKILENVDENLEVFINQENDNYNHSAVEVAEVKSITLYDGDDAICEEKIFAISDDI